MKLFNSMTSQLETFVPMVENEVSMYVCGPTVYNHAHVGNARPIVVFDTLRRTFEAMGYQVKMVSNYTDVDDKIIKVAKELGVEEKEITEKFIQAYNEVRFNLHALMPSASPKVTETMEAIIAFISLLIEKGVAYEIDGDVYFRVAKADHYGTLSNQQIDDLVVGARIDENSKKENPLDFTLWKATSEGIRWQSPWSLGRPGWHTECVVMIHQEFDGRKIDIHGGGMDLKFPHHENEIAQCRVAYDHSIANYWIHNGMINIDGEKMSKSLGNVVWAKDMIEAIGGNVLRWVMLSAHYRAPLNINEDAIASAKKELEKVKVVMKQAYVKLALTNQEISDAYLEETFVPFLQAMEDDLNTPNAFAAVFEAVKGLNALLRVRELDYEKVAKAVHSMEKMMEVLGIDLPRLTLTQEDRDLYVAWNEAKAQKDFASADAYRDTLMKRGIL